MKTKLLLFTFLVVVSIMSCKTKDINYPYEFINSKIEKDGNYENKMDLYAFSDEIDISVLKRFCRDQKQKFNSGGFYFIVIFDNKNNAVFPNSPFTASYGDEEEPQKHIRAFYTYNSFNGYSKLDYYEKNKWESVAKSEDI